MSTIMRALTLLVLGMVSAPIYAADLDDTVLLIGVDVIQLNNRLNPNGYAAVVTEFRLKNIDTGRTYTGRAPSSDRAAFFRLPAGAYCLHSVSLAFSQGLEYCKEPTFDVKEGKINNAGYWRFGVSHDTGAYKLVYAFKHPDELLEQARKQRPPLFDTGKAAGH